MKDWLRRVRGALGMGITWAVGWAPIGGILGSALWVILDPAGGTLVEGIIRNASAFGLLGFVGGTIFSTVLRLAEGSSRFDELTLPRFAILGALGGLVLGGLAVATGLWGASGVPLLGMSVAAVATLLGASSAAGSLALARRADDRDLLEAGGDGAGVSLSEDEAKHLLQ